MLAKITRSLNHAAVKGIRNWAADQALTWIACFKHLAYSWIGIEKRKH